MIEQGTPVAATEKTKTLKKRKAYHHGDLRRALVEAALDVLEKEGIEALSLRNVARKIGVSQAAPYAHFKNKHALLEAIASTGFDLLAEDMKKFEQKAHDLRGTLTAYGTAYVCFAVDHPALFKLMFGPELTQRESDEFLFKSAKSYEMILDISRDLLGAKSNTEKKVSLHAMYAWSFVHGLANLLVDGKLDSELAEAGSAAALAQAIMASPAPMVGPLGKI